MAQVLANETPPSAQYCLGLTQAEHLLLWALRKIAAGRGDCPMIPHEFTRLCGAEAPSLLATFAALLKTLGYASRRRLQISYPGCLTLTGDERQFLAIIAAGQAGDQPLLLSHLRWLMRGEHHATVSAAILAFGNILAARDLQFPHVPQMTIPRPSHASIALASSSAIA